MEMRVFLIGDYVLSKVCLEQTEINGKNKRAERKVARIYNILKLSIFSSPSFILTSHSIPT